MNESLMASWLLQEQLTQWHISGTYKLLVPNWTHVHQWIMIPVFLALTTFKWQLSSDMKHFLNVILIQLRIQVLVIGVIHHCTNHSHSGSSSTCLFLRSGVCSWYCKNGLKEKKDFHANCAISWPFTTERLPSVATELQHDHNIGDTSF